MDNEKKEPKVIVIGEGKKSNILPTYAGMTIPIIDYKNSGIEPLFQKKYKKRRKCALNECSKLFTPSGNECCCSKEHFIKLKEKHKK